MTFQDIFKSSFLENVTGVSILDMALALTLAFTLGLFIFLVYMKTCTGVMYSSSFGVTLVALTMITTLGSITISSTRTATPAPWFTTTTSTKRMVCCLSSPGTTTALYHQYFSDFLNTVDPAALIDEAYALIVPWVERDPTKFCTVEEFETGVQALKLFCSLRTQSVRSQLTGSDEPVDASQLTLSDMGTMGRGGGPGNPGHPDKTHPDSIPDFSAGEAGTPLS